LENKKRGNKLKMDQILYSSKRIHLEVISLARRKVMIPESTNFIMTAGNGE
jgi:hypothetical protein